MAEKFTLLSRLISYLNEHSIGNSFLAVSRPYPLISSAEQSNIANLLMQRPTESNIHLDIARANAFFSIEQYKRAEQIYQQILSANPGNITALYNLSVTLIRLNTPKEALTALNRVIQKEPTLP